MDILSKLSERLAELMEEHNFTPVALAKQIGVTRNTITRYLAGTRMPSFPTFIQLLEVLHCSADFLIGRTDYTEANVVFHPVPPFSIRFRAILDEYRMSQYALHKKTNFSYDNFNKWLKGVTCPYVDNLIKLADAFDCSVDYLIGRIL